MARFNDYLVEVAKQAGYQAGSTLKLILPFLIAHGLTNARLADYCQKTPALVPGAEAAYQFLHTRNFPIFEVSTSYRQFAEAVGVRLGIRRENIFGTELDLDRFTLKAGEGETLRRGCEEIIAAPVIELPSRAKSLKELPAPTRDAIATLERIILQQIPAMDCGVIYQEVKPLGGPEKASAIADSLTKTGLQLADTIFVGDSATDVAAFEAVRAGGGLTISFNGDRHAVQAAEVVLVSDSAWSVALLAAIVQSWGKEGVLEIAAPETRAKSRSLVLPEQVIDPIFSGLDGHLLNIYLAKGPSRNQLIQESLAMRAKLRGQAGAALG